MLVPTLCDWSLVSLLEDDGRIEHISASHVDPAQQKLLDEYTHARHTSVVADPTILQEIVGVGTALFQLTGEEFLERMVDEDSATQLRALSPGFVTAFPILARDRALGVISLYTGVERGRRPSRAGVRSRGSPTSRAGAR